MYPHSLLPYTIAALLSVLLLIGCGKQPAAPIPEGTPVSNGPQTITVRSETSRGPSWSVPAEPDKIYLGTCVSSSIGMEGSVELKDSDGNGYVPLPSIMRYEEKVKQVLCRWFYVPLTARGFIFQFADFPPVKLNY
jgi:hypothetical protein